MIFNNKKIHYEVHGQGQPLIILNGIMMSTKSWHMFLKDLKNYQVILLDFLDQGQSDSCESYGHKDQVVLVRSLVDHLCLDKVNILGISYGGQIALQYAIEYPVDKLMVANCALNTTSWLADIGRAWQLAAGKNDAELFYHVCIPYIYSHHFYNKEHAWMMDRKGILLEIFNDNFFKRMHRLIDSSEGYDIRSDVNKISADTIVVAAEFDYLTPADETIKIHHAIRGSKYKLLGACGHASMYEKPALFIELVKDHFS